MPISMLNRQLLCKIAAYSNRCYVKHTPLNFLYCVAYEYVAIVMISITFRHLILVF